MFSIRSSIPRLSRTIQPRAASLHTSFVAQKSVVENVKETAADVRLFFTLFQERSALYQPVTVMEPELTIS